MENPEGDHDLLEKPERGLEDDNGYNENPLHDPGPMNNAIRGGLEERLLYPLDLNRY